MPTRRLVLAGAGALGAAGLFPASPPSAVAAETIDNPSFFRTRLGDVEVTLLLDGAFNLSEELVTKGFYGTADAGELATLRRRLHRLPAGGISMPVGIYLIRSGSNLVLIDAGGAGFQPTMGGALRALIAAGYRPDMVNAVLLTHMHPEHTLGLVGGPEKRDVVFPNAEIFVNEAEYRFWFDDANIGKVPQGPAFVKGARTALAPYAGERMRFFAADREVEILPGITALPAPGHTVGNSIFRVTSGASTLHVWGDILHHTAIQLARPRWAIGVDGDPALGVESRLRELEAVADTDTYVGGIHLPWPGIGRIVRDGPERFAFVPLPWHLG